MSLDDKDKNQPVIEFRDVRFRYPGSDKYVLDGINARFECGKTYLIVGENGAGKTTLVNLLCRLYDPEDGAVLCNGKNIREMNYLEWRENISAVFQDYKYYAYSVAENVAVSDVEKEDTEKREKITLALKEAGLLQRTEEMPGGIDTTLGRIFADDGINLSGGESQKLALARAIYRDGTVFVLDEPSSALDPYAEAELLDGFKRLSKDKMTIFISHRLTCAKLADEIYYIEAGRVLEHGTHDELMAVGGKYADIYRTQADYYEV